jgi:hypothetical protein
MGSQKWLPYHRPGVYGGWTAYEDRDRTRAIKRWGIPQDVDAEPSITHTLELEHKLSLSLAQHFLFETHCFKLNPVAHAFLSFFFLAVQRSIIQIFLFLFTNFNYLHQNLTIKVFFLLSFHMTSYGFRSGELWNSHVKEFCLTTSHNALQSRHVKTCDHPRSH